jgi:hypothetical protein
MELAPEAGFNYALLQTYIGTGDVSSFSDGTRPELIGTGLQGDEFTFGVAEENDHYWLATLRLLIGTGRASCLVHTRLRRAISMP